MREPDFVVHGRDGVYLQRWWLIPRNRWFNVYLHHFLHSDDDRALHDHPYWNLSILLRGAYREHRWESVAECRMAPALIFRRPETPHRIELVDGRPVWTLFVTGPRVREWGFWCPRGWVHWKVFVSPDDKGSVGKGCDE